MCARMCMCMFVSVHLCVCVFFRGDEVFHILPENLD